MDFERDMIFELEAHGGIGGPGGQSVSGVGGVGGVGQGPQFHVSGTSHWTCVHTTPETVVSAALVTTKQRKLCPLPVPYFTGRQEILQKLHRYFDQAQGTRLVYTLHGLSGSGKSQVAFKFVEEAWEKQCFSDVFYIDATSEQTIEIDFKLLAPAADNTAKGGLSWLASNHNDWLIVFDNANNAEMDIEKFFPPCRFGSILITTCHPQLCIRGVDAQVPNMEPDDASNLLLKLAGRKAVEDNKKELAIAIVKELHCVPLAVSQAGGYINARGDLKSYLQLYQSSCHELLQQTDIQGQNQNNMAVYATWKLNYNKLSSSAKLLLQIFSCLHHQGISKEIFEKASLSELEMDDYDFQVQVYEVLAQLGGSNQTWDALFFNDIVGELQAYSLVEQNWHDQSFSVHPVVQQWSNHTIKQTMDFMQTCVLSIIAMSCGENMKDFKYIRRMLHHTTRLSPIFRKPVDSRISVLLAYIAGWQGRWNDAQALYCAHNKQKRLLAEKNLDTLTSMNHLASTHRSQDENNNIDALHVIGLSGRKTLLGEEHPNTLNNMHWPVYTYSHQSHWSDAEARQVMVLERRKRLLGAEHPDTLTSMHYLAWTYSSQGRWSDAEALQVTVLERRKRVLGEKHADTLASMHSLAWTYESQERWSDAEALHITVLETNKQILGDNHPNTLTSMNNLADVFEHQGRDFEADALRQTVQEIEQPKNSAHQLLPSRIKPLLLAVLEKIKLSIPQPVLEEVD
ncbi:FabD/lysophospholipase-like protein [Favolaschia claudopus]|uniref:FabD/lysophospholipase-like protein n=1 Tax=Favolaschia claudopus TaxID=2862362 RepID=A0AAW0AEF8_9AGAR